MEYFLNKEISIHEFFKALEENNYEFERDEKCVKNGYIYVKKAGYQDSDCIDITFLKNGNIIANFQKM